MSSLSRPRSAAALGAVLAAGALVLTACGSSGAGSPVTVTRTAAAASSSTAAGSSSAATSSSPTAPSTSAKPATPVHVSTALADGQQVGIGMPIIAFLSRPIKDARAFAKATTVTVNGSKVNGAWYFETKADDPGHPIEADYRMSSYWPGHARIHLNLPVKGVSAGPGLAFDDSLTLDFSTGPANVLTVDDATHKVTVQSDGKDWGTFPTSLGASRTPTKRGVKVIMEKVPTTCMHDTDNTYYECGIKYDQRLTYSGEYLHSAPWNVYNIEHGVDSSNGCSNLLPDDAIKLYNFLEVGDVVQYPNAPGPMMTMGDGYGDWNLSWPQWQTGGMYRTT
jgi:lipoprotein-anchoring transpeptidase ErfK/SrfK